MNWLKFFLIALGLILLAMLASSVIGIIYGALWYLLVIGVVGGGAYLGYKLLKKDDSLKLEDKTPISIAEMENADRALEEYKRKYLPK
ncbi:MAG: hypothetical protein ACR2GD_05055 [Pyrinomonadaceae bacterium]